MIGEQIANAAHLALMKVWREAQMEAWLKKDKKPAPQELVIKIIVQGKNETS